MIKHPVLVCVTAQSSCQSIIAKGRQTAFSSAAALEVVSVQPVDMEPSERALSLDTLYKLSKDSGAQIVVYYNDDAAQTIALHARRAGARHIILGQSGTYNHFAYKLSELLPNVTMTVVGKNACYQLERSNATASRLAES